jgi:hypothetical protein
MKQALTNAQVVTARQFGKTPWFRKTTYGVWKPLASMEQSLAVHVYTVRQYARQK